MCEEMGRCLLGLHVGTKNVVGTVYDPAGYEVLVVRYDFLAMCIIWLYSLIYVMFYYCANVIFA